MVKLNRITTGSGDKGTTSLADGSRVSKTSPRVEAYGTVDELNSLLGVARAEGVPEKIDEDLGRIQQELFDLGADLATPMGGAGEAHIPRMLEGQVRRLEVLIDSETKCLAPADSFILPGGSRAASFLHLARTVARRAERKVIALVEAEFARCPECETSINPICQKYLNRLSDLCFVWARLCNDGGRQDVLWQPYHER